jgi:hypothetical protein
MSTGKWAQAGVPHKGWTCTDIEDLGRPEAICQMCEVQAIRYVHHMEHPDYAETLGVGCVCAGHMEQDLDGARQREREFKKGRKRWLNGWRISAAGNTYININGFNVVVFPQRDYWSARVEHRETQTRRFSHSHYPTAEAAKAAAYDAMVDMKKNLPLRGNNTVSLVKRYGLTAD